MHFRAVGPEPSKINLKKEFSPFGEVENAYFVKNSRKTVREGNVTMVGFILFKTQNSVAKLLDMKVVNVCNTQFNFKKNKTLDNETHNLYSKHINKPQHQ